MKVEAAASATPRRSSSVSALSVPRLMVLRLRLSVCAASASS
jgi:hypothetical protein